MSDPQRRLGERYELLGRLSAGPSGTMWCGRDLDSGSGCAIRVLEPGLAADPSVGDDLLAVLARVGRLVHPYIVAVDDVVTGDGYSALVTQLISGESLQTRLDRLGALDPAEATALITQLCDALRTAHAAGLTHGRIKPSNLVLEPGADELFTVKLTDFGMAALDGRGVHDAPRTETAAVSAALYQAPELDLLTPATAAADVYAAGVVLYETLAGRPPFTGTRARDIARLHRESPLPRIPGLPESLWRALAVCLAKQPHLRPAAGDLADLLRSIAPPTPARMQPVLPKAPTSAMATVVVRATATATAPATMTATADLPLFEAPRPSAELTAVAAQVGFTRRSESRSESRTRARSRAKTRRTELAIAACLAGLVGGIGYVVGGAHSKPPTVDAVVPLSTPAGIVVSTTGDTLSGTPVAVATSALPAGTTDSPGSTATAALPAEPTTTAAAPPDAATTVPAPPPPPATSAPTPVTATSTGTGPVTRLPIADPIGFLEAMRARIQALIAQGGSTIDPVAAADLQNLVADLENSVFVYEQNGGSAHLQEIKNKIALFDARLTLLVGQGRISPNAASELAAYLQRLSPA